jgi:hypothetical protein
MPRTKLFPIAAALVCATAALPAIAQSSLRQLRTPEYRSLQEGLCRGWNTWSANSVMAHVHLPDGFALTLGIKTAGMGRTYQDSFYQANQSLGRAEKVRLGAHSDDGSYTDLTLELPSGGGPNSVNAMRVESAEQDGEEYILVTVERRAALRASHLIVETGYYWNRPGSVQRRGDTIQARSEGAGGRAFTVRTTGTQVSDPFLTVNAPYFAVPLEGRIAVYTGAEKTLDQIAALIAAHRSKQQSLSQQSGPNTSGDARDIFTAMQTILGWNLTYDPENNRAISPVSRGWSANWGGYVLFDWDTYFASFMYSLYNRDLAFANAVEITKSITKGGFIPNAASAFHIHTDDRSQPPVGSLIAMEIYKRHPERWFLAEVYDELLRWNRWWPTFHSWLTERCTIFRQRCMNRDSTIPRCMTAFRSTRRPTCSRHPTWGSMHCMWPIAGRWNRWRVSSAMRQRAGNCTHAATNTQRRWQRSGMRNPAYIRTAAPIPGKLRPGFPPPTSIR